MLIIFYILTPYLQIFGREKNIYLRHFICFIVFLILSLFFGADNRMAIYFPFYSIGLLFGSQMVKYVLTKRNIIFSLSLILLIVLYYFNMMFISNDYLYILYHYLVGFWGIISIVSISNYIEKTMWKRILPIFSLISYASMMAYMFHREIYGIIKMFVFPDNFPMWFIPIAIIIVFLISYYMQKAYDIIIDFFQK